MSRLRWLRRQEKIVFMTAEYNQFGEMQKLFVVKRYGFFKFEERYMSVAGGYGYRWSCL